MKGKRGFEVEEIQAGDLADFLETSLKQISRSGGKPATYENTEQGLADFSEKAKGYFRYLIDQNRNAEDAAQRLVPSIEGLCVFLSISRMTLLTYERRGNEWRDVIRLYKTLIYAAKQELAIHGRIAPVLMIFDLCNNYGYINASEFHITPEPIHDTQFDIDEVMRRIPQPTNTTPQIEDTATENEPDSMTLDDYL